MTFDNYELLLKHMYEDPGVPVSLDISNNVIKRRKEIEKTLNKEVKVKIDDLVKQMTDIG